MAKRKRRRRRRKNRGAPPWLFAASMWGLGVVALSGLVYGALHLHPGSSKTTCSLLIDRTVSAQDQATTSHYLALAEDVVQACQQDQGTLEVWKISQGSSQSTLVGTFPLFGVGANGPIRQRSEAKFSQLAMRAVKSVFASAENPSSNGSNIVNGISAASQSLQDLSIQDQAKTKYMVVLTDGLQLSDGVSVDSLNTISSQPQLLVDQANQYLDTNLKGVNVSFYGVNTGKSDATGTLLPLWFEAKVHQFWSDFVTSNHGQLCSYQPDQSASTILNNCGA